MSGRIKRNLITVLVIGAALLAYLLIRRFTGFHIVCPLHFITGFQCPGCGVTRMCDALLRLDLKGAYQANPFLFFTMPVLGFEFLYEFFLPHTDERFYRLNYIFLIFYLAAFILFGILRNFGRTPNPSLFTFICDPEEIRLW